MNKHERSVALGLRPGTRPESSSGIVDAMPSDDRAASARAGASSRLEVEVEGDAPLAPATNFAARRWEGRLLRIAHPVTVLIAMPVAVALVGAALTLSSHSRLKELGQSEAVARFAEHTRQTELAIQSAIAQSDALLDRTRELALAHASTAAVDDFAQALRDLALERRGLKWLSVSFPDGAFQGVSWNDGVLGFQASRLEGSATETLHYAFDGNTLVPRGSVETPYDPRQRPFYRLAVESRRRVWTQPYPFMPDYRTGITRAEAVYDAEGALHAVITADYAIGELSGVLGRDPIAGARVVVFSEDGSLLAVAGMELPAAVPARADRALRSSDLGDPVLGAFFRSRSPNAAATPRVFETDSGRYLAIEQPLVHPSGLGWRVAALRAESELFAPARRHARQGLISSASFVFGAVLLSTALALAVARLRAGRRRAEQRAETAIERARQLGSYQLESLLGAGGMGEVWRARHRLLARPAAIKLIRTDRLGEHRERIEARFQQEARVLASLRSPNTVSVFDFGRTTDGRLFLVMELLDGLTLDRVLALDGPLPPGRVIDVLIGACRSLAEAHAAGLVHRDVKPANLFLCYDGDGVEHVELIDFGLVKVEHGPSDLSGDGGISGTPDYMAPEQVQGGPMDGRTDLYALGCTAFHLLTGRPVFTEPSDVATLLAHQTREPPAISSTIAAEIPAELEQLIVRCLAKDPACRPSSAASLLRALTVIELPAGERPGRQWLDDWWQSIRARADAKPDRVLPSTAEPLTESA